MNDCFTPEQIDQLLRAINPKRVSTDGKGFSHVEAYDVIAHLNRIFGFGGWSKQFAAGQEPVLVFESSAIVRKKNKAGEEYGDPYEAWTVCYRAAMSLTVLCQNGHTHGPYEDAATGESKNQPSRGDAHDLALKTSVSQALKRCAKDLGDQYGLSLYAKGSKAALVRATLVATHQPDQGDEQRPPVDSHITEQLPREDETAEPQPDPRVTNRPAAAPAAADEPPADTTDKEAQRRQAKAQDIRTQAMGEPPTEFAQPGRWHAHLMGEAMKAQVLNERVESLTSTATVSLKRFLEERMKQYVGEQRQAQANEVAS